ncbi:hypothetical protein BACCOPRO_02296 [Phocaeicola coprophilus DSM 18228 = JCM 13818]|uniref:Uncharacterized protein n=1 Tax=Phocaeicola coprophilus DSM 18228 = JCM 13818 TaxID=547042 RepID=S0F9M0_9BACT|nr:hypothetical protein BACCOPRO_02296 [Phocaeicola coprophilus DSM 18228 = JCM 13818]
MWIFCDFHIPCSALLGKTSANFCFWFLIGMRNYLKINVGI